MRSDPELLDAWRTGDRGAGEELFERYYEPMVRFFANKVAGDPADLLQETFAACVSGVQRIREGQNFRSFLFGIAYNKLKHHYERKRVDGARLDFASATAADLAPGPGTMMAKGAEQRLLLTALRQIPLEHQVVLEMFYWEGFTSAAIAAALDQPHGTIRTRIRRARELLEEAMEAVSENAVVLAQTRSDLDGWAAKVKAGNEAPERDGSP